MLTEFVRLLTHSSDQTRDVLIKSVVCVHAISVLLGS